jgi:hypothetical protein
MAGMSRVVTVVIVLAVAAACSLILLYVFRGHGQPFQSRFSLVPAADVTVHSRAPARCLQFEIR